MNKRILAVDDHDDLLALAALAFTHEGFTFAAARSYQEMRAELDRMLPDLIIVDMLLPGVTGYQVLEELHSEPRTADIPIIVITAKSEEIYRRISADLGAARHIVKPFHPDELIAQASAVLSLGTSALSENAIVGV